MQLSGELQSWLPWVIKIRFVLISFIFAIDYAIRVLGPSPWNISSLRYLAVTVILWYVVNLFFLIYNQLSHEYLLQAYLQIYSDIAFITAVVHITGDLDSIFLSLYLIAIIVASILLPRARAFLVAAVSFVLMGSTLEFAYLPNLYPKIADQYPAFRFLASSSGSAVDLGTLQVKIFASLFGFFAVAYLSSYLAESLRKTGAELRSQSGQIANLQAINENIIQSMRDGLITTDLKGTITELNPAGAAILGFAASDVRGVSIRSLFREVSVEDQLANEVAVQAARQEIVYLHPSGERRLMSVAVSPLLIPPTGRVGYVYNYQDITEEKRRDAEYRAKDRMAALGRLSAGIAHEIRNPLASIAGSVKLLRSIAELDDDQTKLINIVTMESERLNKLVTDFLSYARTQRFEFRSMDLTNLLEETLLLVEHHPLFGENCRLERKFPRHPVIISVDPDRMRQVFWNIWDNSLKAMPKGGTLTAEIQELNAQSIRVILSDTGVGFTETQLEKLFEPFNPAAPRVTGLGLAIVYQIVEGHRGRIRVLSKQGFGSTFLIDLPRVQPRVTSEEGRAVSRVTSGS